MNHSPVGTVDESHTLSRASSCSPGFAHFLRARGDGLSLRDCAESCSASPPGSGSGSAFRFSARSSQSTSTSTCGGSARDSRLDSRRGEGHYGFSLLGIESPAGSAATPGGSSAAAGSMAGPSLAGMAAACRPTGRVLCGAQNEWLGE